MPAVEVLRIDMTAAARAVNRNKPHISRCDIETKLLGLAAVVFDTLQIVPEISVARGAGEGCGLILIDVNLY
jgi:hypothetical protein